MVAIFFNALSEHSFMIKMLKKIFFVYTSDNTLFEPEKIKKPKLKVSKTLKKSKMKL
jgi:hypothetical protein